MGVATPLCHGAHLPSPANRVDENPKSRLRRKQESNCGILEKKTPALGASQAGAACVVVDNRSKIASENTNNTILRREAIVPCKKETRAAGCRARAQSWIMEAVQQLPEKI